MGSIRKSSQFLRECLEDSVFELLKSREYSSISVADICEKAGVGRTSFYRYYADKEVLLVSGFRRMWADWCEGQQNPEWYFVTRENLVSFFEFCLSIRDVLSAVGENNLYLVLMRGMKKHANLSKKAGYANSFISYGLIGIVDDWVKGGYEESPEVMTEIVISTAKSLKKYL